MKNIKVLYQDSEGLLNVISTKINMDNIEEIKELYRKNLGTEKVSVIEPQEGKRFPHETIEYLILNGYTLQGWIGNYLIKKDNTFSFHIQNRNMGIILGHVIRHTPSVVLIDDKAKGRFIGMFRLFRHLENYSSIKINMDICDIYDRYDLGAFKLIEKNDMYKTYEGTSPKGIEWRLQTRAEYKGKKGMISLEKEKKLEKEQTYIKYITV